LKQSTTIAVTTRQQKSATEKCGTVVYDNVHAEINHSPFFFIKIIIHEMQLRLGASWSVGVGFFFAAGCTRN
jgi:hypothetical protein